MSPLARLLFALTSTALLGIAWGTDPGACAYAFIGQVTRNKLALLDTFIESNERDVAVDISDNCAARGRRLVGEETTVCDDYGSVDISLGPAFSPLVVHRSGKTVGRAVVHVVQYCN